MIHRLQKLVKRTWAGIAFRANMEVRLPQPLVSFTFDDVPASGFEQGGGILTKYGYAGTFYISLGFHQACVAGVCFETHHLERALENHHELACHTFGHIELSRTPLQEAARNLQKNRDIFNGLFPGHSLSNFSYPFGEQTAGVKKYLSQAYRSARGGEMGINVGSVDRFNLKAIRLYEERYSLDQIFSQLDKAEEGKGWLIFYTHDVQPNPTPWGCTPDYFEAVVREVARRKIKVKTIDNALKFIELKSMNYEQKTY